MTTLLSEMDLPDEVGKAIVAVYYPHSENKVELGKRAFRAALQAMVDVGMAKEMLLSNDVFEVRSSMPQVGVREITYHRFFAIRLDADER